MNINKIKNINKYQVKINFFEGLRITDIADILYMNDRAVRELQQHNKTIQQFSNDLQRNLLSVNNIFNQFNPQYRRAISEMANITGNLNRVFNELVQNDAPDIIREEFGNLIKDLNNISEDFGKGNFANATARLKEVGRNYEGLIETIRNLYGDENLNIRNSLNELSNSMSNLTTNITPNLEANFNRLTTSGRVLGNVYGILQAGINKLASGFMFLGQAGMMLSFTFYGLQMLIGASLQQALLTAQLRVQQLQLEFSKLQLELTKTKVAFDFIQSMFGKFVLPAINFADMFKNTELTLKSLTGSGLIAKNIVSELYAQSLNLTGTFEDLSQIISSLVSSPVIRNQVKTLSDMKDVLSQSMILMQQMALVNPQQGVQGALVALQELLGGQTRSLQLRFNLDLSQIEAVVGKSFNSIKGNAKQTLDFLQAFFGKIVPTELITEKTKTISGSFEKIKDLISATFSFGLQNAYNIFSNTMNNMLNSLDKTLLIIQGRWGDLIKYLQSNSNIQLTASDLAFKQLFDKITTQTSLITNRLAEDINNALQNIGTALGNESIGMSFGVNLKLISQVEDPIQKIVLLLVGGFNMILTSIDSLINRLFGSVDNAKRSIEGIIDAFKQMNAIISQIKPESLAGLLNVGGYLQVIGQQLQVFSSQVAIVGTQIQIALNRLVMLGGALMLISSGASVLGMTLLFLSNVFGIVFRAGVVLIPMFITFSTALMSMLANAIRLAITNIILLANQFIAFTRAGGLLAGVIAILSSLFGMFINVVGKVVSAVAMLITRFNLITGVIIAVGTALVYAYNHFEWFRNVISKIIQFIIDNSLKIFELIYNFLRFLSGNKLPDWNTAINSVKRFASETVDTVKQAIKDPLGTAMNIADKTADELMKRFGDKLGNIDFSKLKAGGGFLPYKNQNVNIGNKLENEDYLTQVKDIINRYITEIGSGIISKFTQMKDDIIKNFSNFNNLSNELKPLQDIINSIITDINKAKTTDNKISYFGNLNLLKEVISRELTELSNSLQSINLPQSITGVLIGENDKMFKQIYGLLDFYNQLTNDLNTFTYTYANIYATASDLQTILSGISSLYSDINKKLAEIDNNKTDIKNINQLYQRLDDIKNNAIKLSNIFNEISNLSLEINVDSIKNKIIDMFKSAIKLPIYNLSFNDLEIDTKRMELSGKILDYNKLKNQISKQIGDVIQEFNNIISKTINVDISSLDKLNIDKNNFEILKQKVISTANSKIQQLKEEYNKTQDAFIITQMIAWENFAKEISNTNNYKELADKINNFAKEDKINEIKKEIENKVNNVKSSLEAIASTISTTYNNIVNTFSSLNLQNMLPMVIPLTAVNPFNLINKQITVALETIDNEIKALENEKTNINIAPLMEYYKELKNNLNTIQKIINDTLIDVGDTIKNIINQTNIAIQEFAKSNAEMFKNVAVNTTLITSYETFTKIMETPAKTEEAGLKSILGLASSYAMSITMNADTTSILEKLKEIEKFKIVLNDKNFEIDIASILDNIDKNIANVNRFSSIIGLIDNINKLDIKKAEEIYKLLSSKSFVEEKLKIAIPEITNIDVDNLKQQIQTALINELGEFQAFKILIKLEVDANKEELMTKLDYFKGMLVQASSDAFDALGKSLKSGFDKALDQLFDKGKIDWISIMRDIAKSMVKSFIDVFLNEITSNFSSMLKMAFYNMFNNNISMPNINANNTNSLSTNISTPSFDISNTTYGLQNQINKTLEIPKVENINIQNYTPSSTNTNIGIPNISNIQPPNQQTGMLNSFMGYAGLGLFGFSAFMFSQDAMQRANMLEAEGENGKANRIRLVATILQVVSIFMMLYSTVMMVNVGLQLFNANLHIASANAMASAGAGATATAGMTGIFSSMMSFLPYLLLLLPLLLLLGGGLKFAEGGIVKGFKPLASFSSFPSMKAFAEGGIVGQPTIGLVGEAGYSEAIIPLKTGYIPVKVQQPKQMVVQNNIISNENSNNSNGGITIVNITDRQELEDIQKQSYIKNSNMIFNTVRYQSEMEQDKQIFRIF